MNRVSDDRVQLEFSMSDPTNPYPSSPSPEQPAYGQQAPQGQPAYGQQAYGQQAYGQPMYALNPAVEKIRSNASTARMLSFLSFLFGGMFLSGGMWFWANKLMEEAQAYGAPMDVVTDVQGARSAAKICTIIHGVIIAVFLVFIIIIPIIIALAGAGSGAFS